MLSFAGANHFVASVPGAPIHQGRIVHPIHRVLAFDHAAAYSSCSFRRAGDTPPGRCIVPPTTQHLMMAARFTALAYKYLSFLRAPPLLFFFFLIGLLAGLWLCSKVSESPSIGNSLLTPYGEHPGAGTNHFFVLGEGSLGTANTLHPVSLVLHYLGLTRPLFASFSSIGWSSTGT